MTLADCKEGDFVILWCCGWNTWDNDCVKIVDTGGLTEVEYRSGRKGTFYDSTKCRRMSF